MKKVLIFGTFDRLHKGHIHFIKKAKEITDDPDNTNLFVVVAKDHNVGEFKGKKPIDNELKRLMNVYLLGLAKKVILGEKEKMWFFRQINQIKPNIICLGYDQDDQGLEEYIKERKLKIKIVKIDAFEPEKYKSSKM